MHMPSDEYRWLPLPRYDEYHSESNERDYGEYLLRREPEHQDGLRLPYELEEETDEGVERPE